MSLKLLLIFINHLFFVNFVFLYRWTIPTFCTGLQNGKLTEKDIYQTKPALSSLQLTNELAKLWTEEISRPKPSIARVVRRAFGYKLIILDLSFMILETAGRFFMPICIGGLIDYFNSSDTEFVTKEWAYIYASGIIISIPLVSILFPFYDFYLSEIGIKVRKGLGGLVYRKTLSISKSHSNDGIQGKSINILSTDLSIFEDCLKAIHGLWRGPLESLTIGVILFLKIGYPALIGEYF